MTYNVVQHIIGIKLSEVHQSVFSSIDLKMLYPAPNNFGKQGWSWIMSQQISSKMSF